MSQKRKIPATMATQHPDNAFAPFWSSSQNKFISTYKEVEEAFISYSDLEIEEYMWDWEGKHSDTTIVYRFFEEKFDYFSKQPLGKEKFLTFRIPNIWIEKGYNLLQALTIILSTEDLANDLKLSQRPLFEVILPMTQNHRQLINIQKLFQKLANFKNNDFTPNDSNNLEHIEIIPLLESCENQLSVEQLLEKYVKSHQKHFGFSPKYIRCFLAGSDSALSSGFLSAVIANKIAISRMQAFSEKTKIDVYPILGYGGLLFRGGLNPSNYSISRLLSEFAGVRTVTLQSSFRYDYPKNQVKRAIQKLEKTLPLLKAKQIEISSQKTLIKIAKISEEFFQQTIDLLIKDMNKFFKIIPKRRDRYQHTGLLAYSRQLNQETLPRAITFTAAFYSIGIPPEFIGLGRTLEKLKPKEIKLLFEHYRSLPKDLINIGGFLNKNNLKKLANSNQGWTQVEEDIKKIEAHLNLIFEASTETEKKHFEITSKILENNLSEEQLQQLIIEASEIRQSLG